MQSPNRKIISIVLSIVMIISSMSVCFSVFAGDTIEIKTADDLKSIKNNLSASYVLADDIAIPADVDFEPIGSLEDPFTGSFNGQGHLISGLTVNKEANGYVGLFGVIGSGATVENLELSVRSIKGQDNVGAIAGANMGTVSGCFVNCGTVEGAGRVGGIVGTNSGTVEKCRANLDLIKGNQIVGGIVALNDENGKIDLCIAMSDIEALNMVGGIFAMSAANTTVSDCVVQNCTITADNSVGGIGWMMHGNASATRLVCSSDVTINCPGNYCYTVLSGGTKGANCNEITVLSEVLDFLTQDAALANRSGPLSHFIQYTIPAEGDGFDAQRPGVWAGKLNEDGTGEINFTVFTGENACLHSNIVDVAAVEATCEEDGATAARKCAECGKVMLLPIVVPALGHNEEIIPGKPTTCTESGLTDGVKCSVCGKILTAQEEIPATGHTEETIPGKAATCTETGLTDGVKCSVCGEILVEQEEIPTLNHRIIDTKAEEATCVHPAYSAGKYCLDCAKYISGHEELPGGLGDHKLVKIYAADPTCYREGQTAGFMCTNKGCTYREGGEVLKKLPHTYNEWTANGDGTHTAECSVCKEAGQPYTWPTSEACTFEWVTVKTADCENDGSKEYRCSVCGYVSETESIPATGHTEETISGKAATCTETGLTDGVKCSVCGEILAEQEVIPALGHDWGEWIVVTDSTCTTAGEEKRVCANDATHAETREISAKGHTFVDVITSPTCITDGYTTHTCLVCGYSYQDEVVKALGHTEETIPGKEATCTETGLTDGVKCSVCGEILTAQEEIPALGHTEETIPGKEATCTETGLTDGVKCSVCGEILVAQEEIPTLNHRIIDTKAEEATCVHPAYSAGKYCLDCAKYISGHEELPGGLGDHKLVKIYAADPTCYREGQTAGFMCTNKGCTYREGGEVLKKLPHTYNEWTANGDGTHTAECSVCKEAGQPYTWPTSEACTFEWVVVRDADCKNDGSKEYKCSVCGYVSETESIPATGHTEETIPGKAATCTETGLTDGVKCSVCGEILVEQEEIPTLNHRIIDTKAEEATCVHPAYSAGKYCLDCAKYISGHEELPGGLGDHKLVKIYAADPTCYREGQTAGFMCINKGCTYREGGEVLKKVPHTYNEWTANGDGTHTAECSVCKEAGQPYTWPTSEACTFEWVVVRDADCTNDGSKEYRCSVCGYVSETESIPATGHTEETIPGKEATCTETGLTDGVKCSVCGEILTAQEEIAALGHTEETIPGKEATCTETGLTDGVKCSACGEILTAQEEIPALGHTEETIPGKEATCTETGLTDGVKCSVCGEILTAQEEIPALGHTEETIPGKAATCTETGLTDGVKCSVCGEILTAQEEIPALGHTEETIPGKAATCTETGLTDGVKCSVCGEILTAQEEIPALGHTEETIPGKEATCTETGLTDGVKCSVCGEILTAQEEIPALGHTEETIPGKEATCTETGLTDGVKCSVCGEILVAQEVVDALGHAYGEWTVVTEATCTEKGEEQRICANDATHVITREIPAKGHSDNDGDGYCDDCHDNICEHAESKLVGEMAATCTEKGFTGDTVCTKCGVVLESGSTIAPIGHAYGKWVVVTEATCTTVGEKQRVCANDANHVETREIPVTPHNDKDGDGNCDDCGKDISKHTHGDSNGDDICDICGKCLCLCHRNNIFAYILRLVCTILSIVTLGRISCCSDMAYYLGDIGDLT